MKRLHFFVFMLGMLTCISFTSCGDDDDDDTPTGKATLTIDGNDVALNYAYWCSEENERANGENGYHLEFYSFDAVNMRENGGNIPSAYSIVFVDIYTSGSINEIPTGSFSTDKYNVYVVLGADEHDQYGFVANPSNSDLVVTKEDGKYKIRIEKVYLDGNREMSFSYDGIVNLPPADWHESE